MSISREEFRRALSRFASGVTVVTVKGADGFLHGITVSAFSSVSLEPPLVLICIDKRSGSRDALAESETFVVNVLCEDQQHLSDRFASHLPDKFDRLDYAETADGIPVLNGALANLYCRRRDAHDAGDHTIFVGEILESTVTDGNPLVYFYGNYRKLKTHD